MSGITTGLSLLYILNCLICGNSSTVPHTCLCCQLPSARVAPLSGHRSQDVSWDWGYGFQGPARETGGRRAQQHASLSSACSRNAMPWCHTSTTMRPAYSTAALCLKSTWSVPAFRPMPSSVPTRVSVSIGATTPRGPAVSRRGPLGRHGGLEGPRT